MSTEAQVIEVAGIPVDVVRKDIKNLHVGVYPPHGRVRVAAPRRLTDEAVRLAVVGRLAWIRRHRAGFDRQLRQSPREMVSGESHYFMGRRYRLETVERSGTPSVRIEGTRRMCLFVPEGTRTTARQAVLECWYRQQLRDLVPALVARWAPKIGASPAEVRIRRMKTRWGSCNAAAGRIWLNTELAKKAAGCLEYLVVHEMVHLLERRHNDRFRLLMDALMPDWNLWRDELNREPLAHADWRY